MILLQADRPKASRRLIAGECHGLLDRIHGLFLLLRCLQIDRQIRRVTRPSLEKTRRFPQAWDVMLEVGESPGYRDAHSTGSGRKFLFQAQEDGLQVLLCLLQGLSISRDIQCSGNDMTMQWRDLDQNRAITTIY